MWEFPRRAFFAGALVICLGGRVGVQAQYGYATQSAAATAASQQSVYTDPYATAMPMTAPTATDQYFTTQAPAAADPWAASPSAPAADAYGTGAAGAYGTGTAAVTAGGATATAGGTWDDYAATTEAPFDKYAHSTTAPSPPPVLMVIPGGEVDASISQVKEKLPTSPYSASAATGCSQRFATGSEAPMHATDLNGMSLPDTCFQGAAQTKDGKHHVFVIGDWGGVTHHPWNKSFIGPIAADHRSKHMFPQHFRPYVYGVDDFGQARVAKQMAQRAQINEPDYILNVGDNFYWGGVNIRCGAPTYLCTDMTGQWKMAFEDVYTGTGIDGKQWLGVLGNHDYGGFMFTAGWDQAIGYTWLTGAPSTNRWVTPAQYWSTKVHYDDFSIDYFFVDSNRWDSWAPEADPSHNICSKRHNTEGTSCGLQGPVSIDECPKWFVALWNAEMKWLEEGLGSSKADWQIIVVHHPPEEMWGGKDWRHLAMTYGIDLIIAGHRHRQEVHYMGDNTLKPTAYLVSGGGGGITSENEPKATGEDDEYGFMDLTVTKREIMVEALSHGGQIRSTTCVRRRLPGGQSEESTWTGASLCDGITPGPQPLPPSAMAQAGVSQPFAPVVSPGAAPVQNQPFLGPTAAPVAQPPPHGFAAIVAKIKERLMWRWHR